jgi:hypothetical protein
MQLVKNRAFKAVKLFMYRNERAVGILKISAIALFSTALAILLYLKKPGETIIFPHCPFHTLTGFYCPGCGSLRAVHELLHGRIVSALDLNPLMVISIPFLGYAFLSYSLSLIRGRGLPQIIKRPIWIWLILAVIIAFWVTRNLPFWPFVILAP